MKKLPFLAMVLLCLASCAPPQGVTPADHATPPAGCGAARLGGYIGQHVDALDAQYLPQNVRIIRPGDAVTKDFNPTRLNVTLNANDLMTAFHCG